MKSNVSDYLELLTVVYLDAVSGCPATVSDLRDLATAKSRVEDEGLSFLTITLPRFCRDFEQALQSGGIDSTLFLGFKKNGLIPAFLQGITSHVFDLETGRLLDEIPPVFVEAVRQICLLFKKLEIPCTPEREHAAIENFIEVERSFQDLHVPVQEQREFSLVSEALWSDILASICLDDLVPRHGPGATAEGISGNQKYVWQEWYERLETVFPFCGNAYSITADIEELAQNVKFVPMDQERPVRVVLVPKTLKSPRVIAIEPVCMQYAQQAARDAIYRALERYWLTKGHVNFTDQSINQRLAITASSTGRYATIDLSDASDRVPLELVRRMLGSGRHSDMYDLIFACRSTHAKLPDGRLIGPLMKFASMGSALCFPIEAMYFYTLCIMARLKARNLPITPRDRSGIPWSLPRDIYRVSRDVYVYGDDIIVPVEDAGIVLDYLQKYNCKVNTSKTFVTGKFRESCGVDAYDGVPVTPVYLRHVRPQNKLMASELVSWIATANLFYLKGYWRTASLMFCTCERILGPLPYVSHESPALGRVSFLGYRSAERWNDSFQSLEFKGWVPSTVHRSDKVDGYSALMKSLLRLEQADEFTTLSVSSVDKAHLERSALRGAVALKRRWVST